MVITHTFQQLLLNSILTCLNWFAVFTYFDQLAILTTFGPVCHFDLFGPVWYFDSIGLISQLKSFIPIHLFYVLGQICHFDFFGPVYHLDLFGPISHFDSFCLRIFAKLNLVTFAKGKPFWPKKNDRFEQLLSKSIHFGQNRDFCGAFAKTKLFLAKTTVLRSFLLK